MSTAPHPAERIRFRRPAALTDVEALHAANSPRLWRVYLETYAFVSRQDGENEFRYRGKERSDGPDAVESLEPGEVMANLRILAPQTVQVLFVDAAAFAAAAELGRPAAPHFRDVQSADPLSFAALGRLHRCVAEGGPPLAQQSLFAAALRRVLERHAERPARSAARPARPAVERAREYLHARVADDVSLDELAAAARASKWHLVRQFRDELGLPPHAYLTRPRVARAKVLLARGEPIARVAGETGFAAQSHLHRHFLRAYGATPGGYARAVRA